MNGFLLSVAPKAGPCQGTIGRGTYYPPLLCTIPTSDGMAAVFQRQGLSKGWICTIVTAVGRIYYSRNRDGIIYSSRTRPQIIYSERPPVLPCWWEPPGGNAAPAIDRSRWQLEWVAVVGESERERERETRVTQGRS